MKVAWLADELDFRGGAELTQEELRAAAPAGVQVAAIRPDRLDRVAGCDAVCLHNCATYPSKQTIAALEGKPVVRYWHDLAREGGGVDPVLNRWAAENATTSVFTSPLQRDRFPHEIAGRTEVIPPPVDLSRFRGKAGRRRSGTCWLGSGMHAGKGLQLAFEWAEEHEPVDFWGMLPFAPPPSERVVVKGSVPPDYVPEILGRYARFLFLPTTTEPFGRAVVEAWAAGCELIVNRNVGALHWIDDPKGLDTAAADYWRLVAEVAP